MSNVSIVNIGTGLRVSVASKISMLITGGDARSLGGVLIESTRK